MASTFPSIDAAIAQFEGFGQPGVPATVNNNPGNLIPGTFATGLGAVGSNGGFAVFPDSTTGFAAENALVQHYADQGLSLNELIAKWAPPTAPGNSPASTQSYQNYLAQATGSPGTTPVSNLAGSTLGNSPLLSKALSALQYLTPMGMSDTIGAAITGTPTMTSDAQTVASGSTTGGFSWGRVGAFVLGLIFIGVGLLLFKPTQEYITTATRRLGEGAEAGSIL